MVALLNKTMNGLFDLLTLPFGWAPPVIGLTFLSLLFGVVLLLLFKYTSPQQTIKRTKQRIFATLYEIRIFKDDLRVLTSAIARLMRDNVIYISCCCVALLPMILIVLPLLFQLDARYGFAPFKPTDEVLMNVQLAEGLDPTVDAVKLELPAGVSLETGPVRVKTGRELIYKLRVDERGEHQIGIEVGGQRYDKRVDAKEGMKTISPSRYKASSHMFDAMTFPIEAPWPDDAKLEAVTLTQARASMLGIDGDNYPWLIIFCIVGLVFGFAMKDIFHVNI